MDIVKTKWKGVKMSEKKMRYTPEEKGYKSKVFQIRISEETFEKLENLSKKKGMTKAEVIRELIENAK